MKKIIKLSVLSLGLTAIFASGVIAAPAIQEIEAYLRPDIKLVVDGTAQAINSWDGTSVIPISYNGTTYLPLRAIGNALNKSVTWDNETQTVYLGATSINDTIVIDAAKQINELENKVNILVTKINNLVPDTDFDKRIKQYLNLSSEINTITNEVKTLDDQLERDFKNGKITYSVYKGYEKDLDILKAKLDNAEKVLIAKTIKDEDIIIVDPDDDDDDDKEKSDYICNINNADGQTKAFNNRIDSLIKQVNHFRSNKDNNNLKKHIDTIENKLEKIDDEVEYLIDCLKDAYKNKNLSHDSYKIKIKALELIEDKIDDLEDILED